MLTVCIIMLSICSESDNCVFSERLKR